MLEFTHGIRSDEDEAEYQTWLRNHPHGIVVNLKAGYQNQLTKHRPHCPTISRDLASIGREEREGKLCFENRNEVERYAEEHTEFPAANLNPCGRCWNKPLSR